MRKYIFALMLNVILFFLCCFLYEGGIVIDMMFLILQFLINLLNYKWTDKVISYLFLNLVMLISSISSIEIITYLYYTNISSDTETLAVGSFAVQVCVAFILLITLIGIVCRIVDKNLNK